MKRFLKKTSVFTFALLIGVLFFDQPGLGQANTQTYSTSDAYAFAIPGKVSPGTVETLNTIRNVRSPFNNIGNDNSSERKDSSSVPGSPGSNNGIIKSWPYAAYTLPYSYGFEDQTVGDNNSCAGDGTVNLTSGWANASGDNEDWKPNSGSTASNGTGPSGAEEGNVYMYVETSDGCGAAPYIAYLRSPEFDFTGGNHVSISFYRHMYGDNIGTMTLHVSTDGGATWSAAIWSLSGDQGDSWIQQTVDLSAYDNAPSVMLEWRYTGSGNSGSNANYLGDAAIDNISIASCEPVADFSADATTVTQGGTINFSDLTTQNPNSWAWSFPGGSPSSSTIQNPSVVYNTPGTYAVTLSATNSCGNNAITKTGYITVSALAACSGSGTIWSEDFTYSNGTTSGDGSPTGLATWSTSTGGGLGANFRVLNNELVYTGSNNRSRTGSWVTTAIDLSAYSNIAVSISLSEFSNLDGSENITCEYSTDGGGSWATFTTNGSLTNDFGSSTASTNIGTASSLMLRINTTTDDDDSYYIDNVVVSGTQVPPTVNDPANQQKCNNLSTDAVNFSGTGTQYFWTNDNTSIGLAANGAGDIASFNALNTGTTPQVATITVTPSNGTCAGTPQTFTITVNPPPTSTVTGFTNVTCFGGSDGTITISASGGTAPYSYSLDNGITWTPSVTDPFMFGGLTADHTFQIKVKDNNGCESKPAQ